MEKSNKLFSDLKPGDIFYHLIFNSDGSKWNLEMCNKLTVASIETTKNELNKELVMHCAISNIELPDYINNTDVYAVDEWDFNKSVCSWLSGSDMLCLFTIDEPMLASDEIKKILSSNSPILPSDMEDDENEDDL